MQQNNAHQDGFRRLLFIQERWYIFVIRGCILTYIVVYSVRDTCYFASHRHTIAAKPLWIRDRGCDDDVTKCDGKSKCESAKASLLLF